jgi:outer membrane protein assembly factor BamB
MPDLYLSRDRVHKRRRWIAGAVAAAVVLAAILITYLILRSSDDDVRKGDVVEFVPEPPPKPVEEKSYDWRYYHRDLAHTGTLPVRLSPPFKRRWTFGGKVLMEFPPIIAGKTLYFVRNNGGTYALDSKTGRVKWKKRIGLESASSPAYAGGRIFMTSLAGGATPGKIVSLRARDGKVLWQMPLSSRSESSPIVRKGVLYVGSESGTLYALWARTGRVKWTFKASGSLKASPALSGNTLYIGDYSGRMYAVWARTGKGRWSSGTSGKTFGLAAGNFYSTPAVAFGRVYAGNTDSRVYSFSAATGELAWSKSTGGYVYSSPAVANVEGAGPSVYIGSYDGNLYALDARTGSTRWTARAGGRISGGPTVVGRIVYFADLDSTSTFGVGVKTGTRLFHRDRGAYNPVVSDGRRIYLTGYSSITALEPVRNRDRQEESDRRR